MLFKNKKEIVANGQTNSLKKTRGMVLDVLQAASKAVDPYEAVKSRIQQGKKLVFNDDVIDISSFNHVYLVSFGKASVGMAQAVCDAIDISQGIAVTNDPNSSVKHELVETVVGGHPIPNQGSINGAQKIVDLIEKCDEDDLLLVLISGGGSALFALPRVELKELQSVTDLLLKCGADINEINTVRKHLSKVKGGQLAGLCNGTLISMVISDIVGDPLSFIASGPTYPDKTSYNDAKQVLEKYDLWMEISDSVREVIEQGLDGVISETPDEKSSVFDHVFNFIVGNNKLACSAALKKAEELGFKSLIVTTSLEGEALEVSKFLVDKILNYDSSDNSRCFISGGETTVTIHGSGRGGRNQEMVLGIVEKIAGKDLVFASYATDGIDGKSDAAGAIADGYTLNRARKLGLNPHDFLRENNSYVFFKKLDDLFLTGPSGTNVMDIQVVIKI